MLNIECAGPSQVSLALSESVLYLRKAAKQCVYGKNYTEALRHLELASTLDRKYRKLAHLAISELVVDAHITQLKLSAENPGYTAFEKMRYFLSVGKEEAANTWQQVAVSLGCHLANNYTQLFTENSPDERYLASAALSAV